MSTTWNWVLENEWGGHVPQISVSVLFWVAVPLAAGVVGRYVATSRSWLDRGLVDRDAPFAVAAPRSPSPLPSRSVGPRRPAG